MPRTAERAIPVESTPRVERIDPLTDPRWDPFVERHPLGWLSHTSAWARVLTESFRHLTPHYLSLVERDEIRAALCLFRVKSWLLGNRLVSLPFTTLCDPLVRNASELDDLLKAAKALHAASDSKFIEVRTVQAGRFFGDNGFTMDRYFKYHQLDLSDSLADVKRRFHRRSIRPCIHRAERSRLVCRRAASEKDVKLFYESYLRTRKRLSLPPLPRDFFLNMLRHLHPRNLDLIVAQDGDRVAGAIVLLKFGSRVSAEASGWDRRYEDERANHLLLWQGIRLAHEEGYRYFDFGRTAADNEPLMIFKARWGTQVRDMAFGFYPSSPGIADHSEGPVIRAVQLACHLTPLPIFPLLGRFCYRHTS